MMKRYQIFVSSTFVDLRHERDEVIRAILATDNIPVGMELLGAADESQWKVITSHIDQSDYYVVVLAHRYGSLTPEGISYTEKEYDYAVSKDVPVYGFVIAPAASWPPPMIDQDSRTRKRLEAFKAKVQDRWVSYWANSGALALAVTNALSRAIRDKPRPGWIRASEASEAQSLLTLQAENQRLSELAAPFATFDALALSMRKKKTPIEVFHDTSNIVMQCEPHSLLNAYYVLCVGLKSAHEQAMSTSDIGSFWALQFGPTTEDRRSSYRLSQNGAAKILLDLESLDLIQERDGRWWLTDHGQAFARYLRRRSIAGGEA